MPSSAVLKDISYDDLYARWERGNWCATEIDFSEDARQWRTELSDTERRAAMWNYAMFLHGEDSVADNLSPYIDAAPREEQKYFLATQQVDEARHSVFFGRFMREVIGGGSYADVLAATRDELTWGFHKVTSRLDRMAADLRRTPSRPMLAAGVALYHVIVEANLAQPGQHFIARYLSERGLLPGLLEGMNNVARDEQRHIGFGVKLLSELIADDPACRAAALDLLGEVLPWAAAVFVPPRWERSYTECFGFTLEEIYTEGTQSLWMKLRTAGFSDDEIARVTRTDPSLPFDVSAGRALLLLRANVLGAGDGPVSRDPEVVSAFFDGMRFAVDHRHSPRRPVTIQWDLSDAPPWVLHIDNGATRVEQGSLPSPDLTFRCRFEDIVGVASGREDPRRAIALRKLRPKGSMRLLWRTQKLFA
jgi:hypothetical protein